MDYYDSVIKKYLEEKVKYWEKEITRIQNSPLNSASRAYRDFLWGKMELAEDIINIIEEGE